MCGDDVPTLDKSHPDLTLPAVDGAALDLSGELQCDAAEVATKCNYVESVYGACEVHSGAAPAERGDFLKAVQVFRSSKAQCVAGFPRHGGQSFCVVRNERGLVLRVKGCQLGNNFGIVDDHR